jgi:hypothetical protein
LVEIINDLREMAYDARANAGVTFDEVKDVAKMVSRRLQNLATLADEAEAEEAE